MPTLNFGVVEIQGRWTVIGDGLRFGAFDTAEQAQGVARRFAALVVDLPVRIHVQDTFGQLHRPYEAATAAA
jgi:hypothetical protein